MKSFTPLLFMVPAVVTVVKDASALPEFAGYYHFPSVLMNHTLQPYPGTWSNNYVSPGDGAQALGAAKYANDLDLAFHMCDNYQQCQWFNGDGGYPGSIGWFNANASVDTYIKNTTGPIVSGSKYWAGATKYMQLPTGMNIWCNKIAGPWSLPPTLIKEQCDIAPTCQGFTVKKDLSSGFLCAFIEGGRAYSSYLKLPTQGSAKPQAA